MNKQGLSFSNLCSILDHYDNDLRIEDANKFFESLGIGNRFDVIDAPYERYCEYESLLQLLQQRNPEKYKQIHKGTPFYFLSWLAFDLKNYEKALYYLDAAILEDIKNAPNNWQTLPASLFLQLSTENHSARRTAVKVRKILSFHIDCFNSVSDLSPITIENFIDKFVNNKIQEDPMRVIISAFYVFLLEYEERRLELKLKSTKGCSMGSILSHLFSGGLIFESLLKCFYIKKTLGQIVNDISFGGDFTINGEIKTSADKLEDILNDIKDDSISTAFTVTSRIRNTAGHNLVWDNIFDAPDKYESLVKQIINALLYVSKLSHFLGG